jgi:hypothetical protein
VDVSIVTPPTTSNLNSNGGLIQYTPSIMEFDFVESADLTSIDVEANIVSMGLIMDDVDLLERWSQGDTMRDWTRNFSMFS